MGTGKWRGRQKAREAECVILVVARTLSPRSGSTEKLQSVKSLTFMPQASGAVPKRRGGGALSLDITLSSLVPERDFKNICSKNRKTISLPVSDCK